MMERPSTSLQCLQLNMGWDAGCTGVSLTLVDKKKEGLIPFIERRAGFKFERIGAPQPADMARIAGMLRLGPQTHAPLTLHCPVHHLTASLLTYPSCSPLQIPMSFYHSLAWTPSLGQGAQYLSLLSLQLCGAGNVAV